MTRRRPLALLAVLLAASAPAARAQDSLPAAPADTAFAADEDFFNVWLTSYLPFLGAAPNDLPMIQFRGRRWLMADYEDKVTFRQAYSLTAGYTPRGGWLAQLRYEAPRLADGWRLRAVLQGSREVRWGYFGLGPDARLEEPQSTDAAPFQYRVRRRRVLGNAEVTRRLSGPLHAALLVQAVDAAYTALPGENVFRSEFGARRDEDEISGRLALVYDTRDTEFDTRRGVLLEGGGQLAKQRGEDYQRAYAVLRGWLPVGDRLTFAGRVIGSETWGTPTLNSRWELPTWERALGTLGGEDTHRALDNGRYTGQGILVANLESRVKVKTFEDYGAVELITWVDGGRVFEGEEFRITTKDWIVGAGLGLGIRVLRGNVFTLTYGWGPDGGNFNARTGWMF